MIQVFNVDNIVILEIHENEMKEVEDFLSRIQNETENNHFNFLIDLKEVSHISSIVLGTFVTTFRNLQQKGGHLKFVNVQPCVANVFEMTRLNRIFEFFNDRETAIHSFPAV